MRTPTTKSQKSIGQTIIILGTLALLCLWKYDSARQQGWYDGNRYADGVWEEKVNNVIEDRIAGARRVMEIREKSAYQRGFNKCEEQF
jgi:hypothetical protein